MKDLVCVKLKFIKTIFWIGWKHGEDYQKDD